MRKHTQEFKEKIKQMGRQLDSKITFDETELGNEQINAVTPVLQSALLKSVMKELDIDSNVEIPVGTVLNYKFGVLLDSGDYEYLDFGNYQVYSSEKQEDNNAYNIVAYDKMLNSMVEYTTLKDTSKTFPMTVRDYISAICNDINLVFKNSETEFANYDKVIQTDLYANLGYTYRDILDELAQVTASNIIINENDELEIKYITDTDDTIDEEYLKDINVKFGEKYGKINSIVLSRSAGADNVYLQDEQSIADNGLCELKIVDNQIMNFNDRSDYLPAILEKLDGLEYYTNDFSSTGICYYEVTDRYNVKIGENTYSCVMFNDEIDITQGLEEVIHTDLPEQAETDYTKADKTDRRINQTYIIVDKQNQQIESVVSQVDDQNEKISQVTQTVDELNSKIQNIADITVSDSTLIGYLELNNINASEPINIVIRPIGEDISYLYPHENLFPSETLFMKQRTLRFHNKKTDENIDYVLPDDLLYYDANNYDEFRLDYDTQTCQVIKKVEYNADGTKRLLTLPETKDYEYPTINLTDGDYEIILLGYESAYLSVRLMTANIYTTQFATKIELNSSINQLANQIELKVSEKINKDEIIASLNLAVENDLGIIELKGNHVIIDADNFKLDKLGNITAKDASLTNVNINNGNINITDEGRGKLSHIELNSTGEYASKLELNSFSTTRITTFGRNTFRVEDSAYDGIRMYVGDEYSNWSTNCNLRPQGLFVHSSYSEEEGIVAAVSSTGIYTLNNETGDQTTIVPTEVRTPKLTQTSLESQKKNFEIFNNALSIIEDIDIYKYNLKSEDDNHKKHIGFVIGENYNYSSEITAIDDKGKEIGVDTYSMSSLNTQAIKELLERIKVLERKVENG